MANVLNENAFELIEDDAEAVKAPKKEVASKGAASSKRSRAPKTVEEKVEEAHKQLYVTFVNATDRYLPLGGVGVAANGELRLHKAQGTALLQSEIYKNYERMKWMSVK